MICVQLYEDLSTWRSKMKKKTAISVASTLYKLEPSTLKSTQHVAYVQDTTASLLEHSMFLRDGLNENVKTYALSLYYFSQKHRAKHRILLTLHSRLLSSNFFIPALTASYIIARTFSDLASLIPVLWLSVQRYFFFLIHSCY